MKYKIRIDWCMLVLQLARELEREIIVVFPRGANVCS